MPNLCRAALCLLLLAGCNLPPDVIATSPNSIVLLRLNPPYGAGLQASFDRAQQHCVSTGREATFLRTVQANVGVNDIFECRRAT
jgi:hypothetical protein